MNYSKLCTWQWYFVVRVDDIILYLLMDLLCTVDECLHRSKKTKWLPGKHQYIIATPQLPRCDETDKNQQTYYVNRLMQQVTTICPFAMVINSGKQQMIATISYKVQQIPVITQIIIEWLPSILLTFSDEPWGYAPSSVTPVTTALNNVCLCSVYL